MLIQTLLTDHCSIKIKPTLLRDPNSNKNRKKREGQKDKRTERQKTETQKDKKIGSKILFNCNLVKSLSLMTLHSRALYQIDTINYLPRILVRYQACHVTHQLKISSIYLFATSHRGLKLDGAIGDFTEPLFWGSYKFSLDLKLHLILVLYGLADHPQNRNQNSASWLVGQSIFMG